MTKQTYTRYVSFLILFFSFFFFLTTHVYAAKQRVRKKSSSSYSAGAISTYVPYSRAKLNRPANSVVVTFLNVDNTRSSTYTLSYKANDIQQGAVGTVAYTGNNTEVRDLYFGTCSHGVCTAHYNITNATLVIETTTTSGGVYRKQYVIRM